MEPDKKELILAALDDALNSLQTIESLERGDVQVLKQKLQWIIEYLEARMGKNELV